MKSELQHHKGVLFFKGIPIDTKNQFKAACARKGQTMQEAIVKLMRQYILRK